jgi:hypothetical protein
MTDFYNHLSASKLMFIHNKLKKQFNTRKALHLDNPHKLPRELEKLPQRLKDVIFVRYNVDVMIKYPKPYGEEIVHDTHNAMALELLCIESEMARRYQLLFKEKKLG